MRDLEVRKLCAKPFRRVRERARTYFPYMTQELVWCEGSLRGEFDRRVENRCARGIAFDIMRHVIGDLRGGV